MEKDPGGEAPTSVGGAANETKAPSAEKSAPKTPQRTPEATSARSEQEPSHQEVTISTSSIQMMEKALQSALLTANTQLDSRLVQKLVNAQIATMNYTRVLALVVMLFLANAIFGGIAVAIVVTADPYDGPNPVLAGIVVLGWIATLIVIITRIVKAMSEARAAREST